MDRRLKFLVLASAALSIGVVFGQQLQPDRPELARRHNLVAESEPSNDIVTPNAPARATTPLET